MANGQFTADIAGDLNRGLQFRQEAQLRPIQQQAAQQGLQLNQQNIQARGLQNQVLQQGIDQRTDEQKNKSLLTAALNVQALPDNQIVPFFEQHIANVKRQGGDASASIKAMQLAVDGKFDEVRTGAENLINIGVRQGDIPAPAQAGAGQFTLGNKRFSAGGKVVAEVTPPVKLSPVQQKIADEGIDPNSPAGFKRAREINQGTQTAAVEIPNVLLTGLSEQVAEQGAAAFSAAGGGKDGLTAFQKIVDAGTEQEKRIASPQMLKSIFPQASKAETVQLQAAMDAAKTTEAGLKDAGKIRVEQQRLKKASGFQTRAVDLLNNILDNPEINDVIGSIEGSDESVLPFGGTKLRSDGEVNAISDIKEAVDILTADNLSLMTGVLSETDIQIIKNLAGGALNRLRSEGRFIEDVTKLRDKLSSKLVQTADDTAKDRSVGSELQEGQIINNKQTGQRLQVVNGQLVEVQ